MKKETLLSLLEQKKERLTENLEDKTYDRSYIEWSIDIINYVIFILKQQIF